MGDAFEERVQMDLGIDYATISRQATGEIDAVQCDLEADGNDRYIGEISVA